MNIVNRPEGHVATREFIDQLASLLAPWRVPATAGRLYAYLLLCDDPVSLEDIAADLDMSKAGAWNAARFLEQSGNIRRFSERGSKRIYFTRSHDMAPCQLDQMRAMGAVGRLLRDSADAVAQGPARDRLERIGGFCIGLEQMVAEAYEHHERQAAGNSVAAQD
ncbi:GbsR/MarR family transcriptional regulator [Novosphingobium bradum]|uniref:GbsR/MarR family transcriptional regulator n=1 Tax=Novosphingobium bradum TaxID=1737444 RepID=A0ABV7IJG9_9SPHN